MTTPPRYAGPGRDAPLYWNCPNWRTGAGYPPPEAPDDLWRWEFLRRRWLYRRLSLAWEHDPSELLALWSRQKWYHPDRHRYLHPQQLRDCTDEILSWWHLLNKSDPTNREPPPDYFNQALTFSDILAPDVFQMTITFNLRLPLEPQLTDSARILRDQQEITGRNREINRKNYRETWPRFLRALDARDDGASYAAIAKNMQLCDRVDSRDAKQLAPAERTRQLAAAGLDCWQRAERESLRQTGGQTGELYGC